jgi:hypothetical protein
LVDFPTPFTPIKTILYGSPLFFAANAFLNISNSSFGVNIFAIDSFNASFTVVDIIVNEAVFVFNKPFLTLSHKFSDISSVNFFPLINLLNYPL